jgi:hypothetical protein
MVALKGKQCRCSHCGEFFTRLRTFERHRVGSFKDRGKHRRCLSEFEMYAKGWSKNRAGFWVMELMGARTTRAAGWHGHRRDRH